MNARVHITDTNCYQNFPLYPFHIHLIKLPSINVSILPPCDEGTWSVCVGGDDEGMRGRQKVSDGDLIRGARSPVLSPAPNEGFVMARRGRRVSRRGRSRRVESAARPTSTSPAQCDSTPANPQHIETRPRLMCYSFHVEKREGPEE